MGFPMAVNLHRAGFDVIGYDALRCLYKGRSCRNTDGGNIKRGGGTG